MTEGGSSDQERVDNQLPSEKPMRVASKNDGRRYRLRIARTAIVPLRLPVDQVELGIVDEPTEKLGREILAKLISAAEADPRVKSVSTQIPSGEGHHSIAERYFDEKFSMPDVAKKDCEYNTLRLPKPLCFVVQVPKKNQAAYLGMKDIPSDRYEVLWDGIIVFVMWQTTSPKATFSGGHVVLDIVRELAEAAGYGASIVPCTPTCTYRFLHVNFLVTDTLKKGGQYEIVGESHSGPHVEVPWKMGPTAADDLKRMYYEIATAINAYASSATISSRMRQLAFRARATSAALMSLNYLVKTRPKWWNLRRIGGRISLMGWRGYRAKLIAEMWLCVAAIEYLEPSWRVGYRSLEVALQEGKLEVLRKPLDPEAASMQEIDMSTAKQTLADLGSRLDNRQLFFATLGGGLAAAIAAFVGAGLAS